LLLTDGDLSFGVLGRERVRISKFFEKQTKVKRKSTRSKSKIPTRVRNYATKMAKITGVDFQTALNSGPVQNYWQSWNEQKTSY